MRPTASIALVVTALLVGACAEKDDGDGARRDTPTTAGAAPAPISCAAVPAGLVSEHLGLSARERPATGSERLVTCFYDTPDGQVAVRLRSPVTSADFATAREGFVKNGAPVTDVPDLGDEAFTASVALLGTTTNSLVARQDRVEVLISAKAPTDKLRNLMTAVLTRL